MYFNVPPEEEPRPSPTDKPADIEDEARAMAIELFNEGFSAHKVRKELIAAGCPEETAAGIVDELAGVRSGSPRRRVRHAGRARDYEADDLEHIAAAQTTDLRAAGQRNMLIGGVICFVGIVITIVSMAAASGSGGGRYILAWGAIVFGAIQFIRGMGQAGAK